MLRKCMRCVAKHYHDALTRPRQHKAVLLGNVLALFALVLGAFGYYETEHITGASGIGLVVWHLLENEA